MNLLLDTSIVIPYLGEVAYDRVLWAPLIREQVYICSVTGMELLAGSLTRDQRQKALAFVDRLDRGGRVVTPTHGEWLRGGTILARFQNRFGHVEPVDHENDILILLNPSHRRAIGSVARDRERRSFSHLVPLPCP